MPFRFRMELLMISVIMNCICGHFSQLTLSAVLLEAFISAFTVTALMLETVALSVVSALTGMSVTNNAASSIRSVRTLAKSLLYLSVLFMKSFPSLYKIAFIYFKKQLNKKQVFFTFFLNLLILSYVLIYCSVFKASCSWLSSS